jgi:hypothetical protein
MALVIARIRSAEERERGEGAQNHQSVNGEKLFMSLSSVDCTQVEYATERYSESPPPVSTKTDKGDTALRKRRRGFAPRIQVELDSSSDKARLPPDQFICRQIDHNEMLQRRLAHSTKLLCDAERIAIGQGNPPAPQVVRPLALALPPAPIPPLDWRQLSSSKCPSPPRRRMRQAMVLALLKKAGNLRRGEVENRKAFVLEQPQLSLPNR